MLFPAADAVIMHTPTPLVVPLIPQGPDAANVTASPEEAVAASENVPPYWILGKIGKLIVCDCRFEP